MAHLAAEAGPSRTKLREKSPVEAETGRHAQEEAEDMQSGRSESEGESEHDEIHNRLPPRQDVKGKSRAMSPDTNARRVPRPPVSESSQKKSGGSWTDLDLSIVVALVSPIGNWLTGGDHIKNVFLIILLVFYLHQIIEIPWQLYQAARPRKPGRRAPSHDAPEDEKLAYFASLAQNELRRSEIFYLMLAILSPFIGAVFLQHILSSLGEGAALSWFSTTLFVLATGIRPWSHFINRLNERTAELHTAVHYPDEDSLVHLYEQSERTLHATLQRVESLEQELNDLRASVKRLEQLREVCDDLTDLLGNVERAAKRNERKADAARAAQSVRLTALEQNMIFLEERRKRDVAAFEAAGIRLPKGETIFKEARSSLAALVDKLLYIPRAIILLGLEDPYAYEKKRGLHIHLPSNGNGNLNGSSQPRIRSPEREKHLPHLVPRLETIPEAEDSDSDGTFVSDKDGPGGSLRTVNGDSNGRSKSVSSTSERLGARKAQTRGVRAVAFSFVQAVVLWPYLFSIRFLLAVFPPARKIVPGV